MAISEFNRWNTMTSERHRGGITDEESFALAHAAFLKALKLAAQDAAAQCQVMGHFNVAWELKNDVAAGAQLLSHRGGNLSPRVREGIQELLSKLERIPDSVLTATRSSTENMAAMKHESWTVVRVAASKLLAAIEASA